METEAFTNWDKPTPLKPNPVKAMTGGLMVCPVISIAHLPSEATFNSLMHYHGFIAYLNPGVLMYIPDLVERQDGSSDFEPCIDPAVEAIFSLAAARGYYHVRICPDGDEIAGLPTYDW
jgi:hypothetical protein